MKRIFRYEITLVSIIYIFILIQYHHHVLLARVYFYVLGHLSLRSCLKYILIYSSFSLRIFFLFALAIQIILITSSLRFSCSMMTGMTLRSLIVYIIEIIFFFWLVINSGTNLSLSLIYHLWRYNSFIVPFYLSYWFFTPF